MGVRVLVDGYWGFQGSAVWTADEAARLAQGAVAQARANGAGRARHVELGPPPPAATGEWVMPVAIDPFTVPHDEKVDFLTYVMECAADYMPDVQPSCGATFQRQRTVFASTDGSAWSQTTYLSAGMCNVTYRGEPARRLPGGAYSVDYWSPAGKGWEMFVDSPVIDDLPRLFDEAAQTRYIVPVEVDRCDMVFSAQAMAALLDATLGSATELDRALGYEANADGTSYLDEPLDMLGMLRVGSPLLNVTANRSLVGGAATVKWDDESVVPRDFTIVKDGVLVDFQTTREQADWLAPYYHKIGQPVASHGCAGAESAMAITMQQAPNLQLMPGTADTRFDELVSETGKGVAVVLLSPNMDQQQLNGVGYGRLRKIVNGKLGPYIAGAGIQFRASDLWKNLVRLGGSSETRWYGMRRRKGQPEQQTTHSVGAVPARINTVNVIDIARKV
jgi:TldD protein